MTETDMTEPAKLIIPDRIEPRERAVPAVVDPNATPMQMLAIATSKGYDVATLEKFMELADRYEKNEARKAYVEAMAAFKAEPTRIFKTKDVSIPGGAHFKHAVLADV